MMSIYDVRCSKIKLEVDTADTPMGFICPKCFHRETVCDGHNNHITLTLSMENFDISRIGGVSFTPGYMIDQVISPKCPKCGEYMFQIDNGISWAVEQFNNINFRTMFSCEGHEGFAGVDTPYISFGFDDALLIKKSKAEEFYEGLKSYMEVLNSSIQFAVDEVQTKEIADTRGKLKSIYATSQRFNPSIDHIRMVSIYPTEELFKHYDYNIPKIKNAFKDRVMDIIRILYQKIEDCSLLYYHVMRDFTIRLPEYLVDEPTDEPYLHMATVIETYGKEVNDMR